MPRTIRFHLDEHVDPAIADGLRRRGIDVTSTAEEGLLGKQDSIHLAFALRQGRVIFTCDEDFLRIHASGVEHAGIAFCHQKKLSIGAVVRGLYLIWEVYEPEEMRGRVEFL